MATGVALLMSPAASGPRTDTVVGIGARPSQAAPAPRCGPEPTTARGWRSLFDRQRGAWAGADVVTSVRLPDGRLLWMFGDTFVGGVSADGRRAPGTRLVRNSVVVTDGGCFQPLPTAVDALPGRDGTWLWPTHAVVSRAGSPGGDSTVEVFGQRMRRTGAGAWGFSRVSTVVVDVQVGWRDRPAVGAVHDLPDHGVAWGSSLLREGDHTWVYGTRAVPGLPGRELLLARAPSPTVGSPGTWTFRTADGWSTSWRRAVPVRSASAGVSTSPSAARVGGRYVIVTKAHEFLDPQVVALVSSRPWGPWRSVALFTAESDASVLRYSPALVAGSRGDRLIVAVCQTSASLPLLMSRAELAYPVFREARLPR